ncbi:hypothetical protein N780_06070 [Pontibacillus chungwhensis BH030062]|uniref:DUF3953 domain-containing protein n=1 Tax=Pontibacillus chungwhensis BH030062 TaxID=1385513 RepID=A0A0A2UU87_9BACI|nr:hypothetical protein [Pontibacillus chungwhensis]KGP90303.1 hypothetical protein N780_06070 [Pontibacillus chungwhensis BH030062]
MVRKVNLVLPGVVLVLCFYDLFINSLDWPIEVIFSLVALMFFFLGLEELREKKKLRGGVCIFTTLVLVTGVVVDLVREIM